MAGWLRDLRIRKWASPRRSDYFDQLELAEAHVRESHEQNDDARKRPALRGTRLVAEAGVDDIDTSGPRTSAAPTRIHKTQSRS